MTVDVNPPIGVLTTADLTTSQGRQVLIAILDQLFRRTGGGTDLIANLEVSQTSENGGNRTYRRWEDEIHDLKGQVVECKRQNRHLEQQIYELNDALSKAKRDNRRQEQELNEIIERLDSGT